MTASRGMKLSSAERVFPRPQFLFVLETFDTPSQASSILSLHDHQRGTSGWAEALALPRPPLDYGSGSDGSAPSPTEPAELPELRRMSACS